MPNGQIEPRQGTQQAAIDYCTKTESRAPGPVFGAPKVHGPSALLPSVVSPVLVSNNLCPVPEGRRPVRE